MFSFSSYTIFVLFPKADLSWLLKFVSASFQKGWGYQISMFSRDACSWAEGLKSSPMVNAEGSMQENGSSSVVRSLFPGRHLECSPGLAGSRGVSPLRMITFGHSAAHMNWPLVLAVPLGSAGLRYVNIRQVTCRERKLGLVNKNQVRPEFSEEGNIAPLCLSQNRGFALTLVVLVTPLQAIRIWALCCGQGWIITPGSAPASWCSALNVKL